MPFLESLVSKLHFVPVSIKYKTARRHVLVSAPGVLLLYVCRMCPSSANLSRNETQSKPSVRTYPCRNMATRAPGPLGLLAACDRQQIGGHCCLWKVRNDMDITYMHNTYIHVRTWLGGLLKWLASPWLHPVSTHRLNTCQYPPPWLIGAPL